MPKSRPSPGDSLRSAWRRLAPLPGGRRLFSRMLGLMVPYSATIRPLVLALEPGYALIRIRDRRAVRNHLDSIHAIALANAAELASGLAMLSSLPATARGIPIRFSIDFLKKARGPLEAECRCTLPDVTRDGEHDLTASVRNAAGEAVARATVRWRLGPVEAGIGNRESAIGRGGEERGGNG